MAGHDIGDAAGFSTTRTGDRRKSRDGHAHDTALDRDDRAARTNAHASLGIRGRRAPLVPARAGFGDIKDAAWPEAHLTGVREP